MPQKVLRFARDLMVQEAIIRDLQKNNYSLISTTEGPDLAADDPTRKLIRQIFGSVSEYEKTMLVMKLRAARERQRAKTGRCEGRKGFGETQEEQAVIRRMRALRRKRHGKPSHTFQAIADKLNSEGITTKDGKQWTKSQVHRVLNR